MCILEHIIILGYPIYLEVIAIHFIMHRREDESTTIYAPHLEVGKQHIWSDVGVKSLRVSEFPHPHILDNCKDKLRSILLCLLVGAAVGSLGFVRRFCAHADDSCGIIINFVSS